MFSSETATQQKTAGNNLKCFSADVIASASHVCQGKDKQRQSNQAVEKLGKFVQRMLNTEAEALLGDGKE